MVFGILMTFILILKIILKLYLVQVFLFWLGLKGNIFKRTSFNEESWF